ncbi:glycosyltransferase family 4 protein [Spirillospora sp. NPDC047279]|uniref:glycosyltransferase family 4 protein n=1 Tax=Spirillospora sp. NPDC047279 TaxID=3155478 RepID=UPI0033F10CEC
MRICVCTVVHHAEDARILHRQIRVLLDAGHDVTYLAPFSSGDVTPWAGLTAVDLPRAGGVHRLRALRAARRALAEHAPQADLLLVHDPELLATLPFVRRRPPTVWDVHEDAVASLVSKTWLPRPLRFLLRPFVRAAELYAERRVHLILAEEGYRPRFRGSHPVVPNTTFVPSEPPPPAGDDRVVYLGHLSAARGAAELLEVARLLAPEGIKVELIGGADPQTAAKLREANRADLIRWHGYRSNDTALGIVEGALAGLSLLHDMPNYRHSVPTKMIEYMARGIPVVTTPLPAAVDIVNQSGAGLIVPYLDPEAAATAILNLRDDPALRAEMASQGHLTARLHFHWPDQGKLFVSHLEEWAGIGAAPAVTGPPVTVSQDRVT